MRDPDCRCRGSGGPGAWRGCCRRTRRASRRGSIAGGAAGWFAGLPLPWRDGTCSAGGRKRGKTHPNASEGLRFGGLAGPRDER